jgi:hypothetical protein
MELNPVEIQMIVSMLESIKGMSKKTLGMDVSINIRDTVSNITVTMENGDKYQVIQNAETESEHRHYIRSGADA